MDFDKGPNPVPVGYDVADHNANQIRMRFDLGSSPAAWFSPAPIDPSGVARERLAVLLRNRAEFVSAELVQANSRLYEAGTDSAAALVMFSFDPTVTAATMRGWAARLHPLKHTRPADPVLREAVRPLELSDEEWAYHRRTRLPAKFTGGREVFVADLWVRRPFLDGRFLHSHEDGDRSRPVPCLV
ncbi:MAG: hypothetical protein ACRC7O_08065, partial [Fimbriiglobus sp.]